MTYCGAAELFQQGRIDFDGLRAIVAKLPLPVQKPEAKSVADIYHIADMPDDDNSLRWLESLYYQELIDNHQLEELIDVAVDGKEPVSPV